jgi:transcriptional regulator with XRE-family HTH domain
MSDPAVADIDDVLDRVGPRLRALRHGRGLTLEQLAASTGLSVSKLSRLESGLRRPTLDVLIPLARAYRVQLDELVGAPATGDPRLHPKPVTRYGMTWIPLSQRPGGVQAAKLIMPVGYPHSDLQPQRHEGYEWVYVLDGKLRLLLGEHDFELTPGQVAEFDTRTPHAFANAGSTPMEMLMLVGPQGERAHTRAQPVTGRPPA